MPTAVVAAIIAVGIALPVLAIIVMYNRFVRQRALIESSWSGVDVELTRRHDLIPNLVRTVQGYAAHEKAVLRALTEARERAASREHEPPGDRDVLEEEVGRSLAAVMARAEAYPELKAAGPFLELQRELIETEDRIAASRRFYNLNVGAYNTRVGTVPSNLIAAWFKFAPSRFFEISDASLRAVPDVAAD